MAKVVLRENESVDSLVTRFKRQVTKEDIINEYKKHQEFLKKSLARKIKSENHQRKVKMRQAKNRKNKK